MKNQLKFVYGPMGSSKTATALMERFEYIQKGFGVTLLKPSSDTRDGQTIIRSRIGLEAEAQVIHPDSDIVELVCKANNTIVIVDEAQFLSAKQVDTLREIADMGYEVICYGLKTDFQANLFEGSARLFALADIIKELEVVCSCGRKAIINARLDKDGNVVTKGDIIDCGMHYKSMCYHCWNAHIKERVSTSRIEFFLNRLDHPKNEYARKMMPKWYKDSVKYAKTMIDEYHYDTEKGLSMEYLRVLYICNHMCPNLAHLKHKPSLPVLPRSMRREPEAIEEYQRMLFEYEYENTQAAIVDSDGKVIQEGINHTAEELALIAAYVEKIGNENAITITNFGFACGCCGTSLIPNQKAFMCPDCGALFCDKECYNDHVCEK